MPTETTTVLYKTIIVIEKQEDPFAKMDWIHCNSCYKQNLQSFKVSLTSCGHLYCDVCVQNVNQTGTCPFCSKKCSAIALDKAKSDVREYFLEPEDISKKLLKVIEFQKSHRRSLFKKFFNGQKQLLRMAEEVKLRDQKLHELMKENKMLKQKLFSCGYKESPRGVQQSPHGVQQSPARVMQSPAYANQQQSQARPPIPQFPTLPQSHLVTPHRILRTRISPYPSRPSPSPSVPNATSTPLPHVTSTQQFRVGPNTPVSTMSGYTPGTAAAQHMSGLRINNQTYPQYSSQPPRLLKQVSSLPQDPESRRMVTPPRHLVSVQMPRIYTDNRQPYQQQQQYCTSQTY